MTQKIFVSYRREDSAGFAGRIFDRLTNRFGKRQIFMDVAGDIPPGTTFPEVLAQAIEKSDVVLVIIGPRWSTAKSDDGRLRLRESGDYVRLETATALESQTTVIPVLVDGAKLPNPNDLPEDLQAICQRQSIVIRSDSWDFDMGRLVAALGKDDGDISRRRAYLAVAAVAAVFAIGWFVYTPPTPQAVNSDEPGRPVTDSAKKKENVGHTESDTDVLPESELELDTSTSTQEIAQQESVQNKPVVLTEAVVLRGHYDWVLKVGFDLDGTRIFTASSDGTIVIWKTNGSQIRTTEVAERGMWLAEHSPSGGVLTMDISSQREWKLWSRAGSLLAVFPLESRSGGSRHWASFDNDGSSVVAANYNDASVWGKDGTHVVDLKGHERLLTSGTFSNDGSKVLTASEDKTARIWAVSGELLATLTGHRNELTGATFNVDDTMIATSSRDKTVRIWDKSGESKAVLWHDDIVSGVEFSPDGALLLSLADDFYLWPTESYTEPLRVPRRGYHEVKFSPSGSHFAAAGSDGNVRVWSKRGQLVGVLQGHTSDVRSIDFSSDGTKIVSGSYDSTARLWDISSLLASE